MKSITINQPKKLELGKGAFDQLVEDLKVVNPHKLFVMADQHVAPNIKKRLEALDAQVCLETSPGNEPSFVDCESVIKKARAFEADFILGVGGGSVLDMTKLVAALMHVKEPIREYVGKGLIKSRNIPLVCVPTTSGAGSESSPNAIIIDENDYSKKGIIDAALVPDAVYIDPELTATLPPDITAYTGLDALTHCIEAYANKNAHPMVDIYALEGIRLISQNLGKAIKNGNDLDARTRVALGAYYGGMCLGPVNTAAVHALSYPLGTSYKIAHGLSNALLLPSVLEFNLDAAADRYANIALVMGGKKLATKRETAQQGIELIRQLIQACGMPSRLSTLDIDESSFPQMAEDAIKIQRLLKNNVREVKTADAVSIYKSVL